MALRDTDHRPRSIPRPSHRPVRAFLFIFALSFPIQILLLSKTPQEQVRPHTRWEIQAIAVSLAETGRFADPYMLPTGPTSHLPPIPPLLKGVIYRLFGLTLTAGYLVWLLDAIIFASLWGLMPWAAARLGLTAAAGWFAGVVGALLPESPGHGEGLAALSLALLTVAFATRWHASRQPRARSLLLGIAAGASFHVQPAILPVVLGWMLLELWWRRDRRTGRCLAMLALGMSIACLPWGWRNYRALDAIFFVRSNLGLELRMGNHDGATATMDAMDRMGGHRHPRTDEREVRRVQELGEIEYMREAGREAVTWINAHPGTFARLTASRFVHWWCGPLDRSPTSLAYIGLLILALLGSVVSFPRISARQRAALLAPLLAFPLIYYIVAYMPRYRQPVDWIFLLLAGSIVVRSYPTGLVTRPRKITDRVTWS